MVSAERQRVQLPKESRADTWTTPLEEQDRSSYSVVSADRQRVQLPTESLADACTTPRKGQDEDRSGTPRWFHQRASSSPTAGAALRRLRRVAQARRRMAMGGNKCPGEVLRALSWGGGRERLYIIVMDPM